MVLWLSEHDSKPSIMIFSINNCAWSLLGVFYVIMLSNCNFLKIYIIIYCNYYKAAIPSCTLLRLREYRQTESNSHSSKQFIFNSKTIAHRKQGSNCFSIHLQVSNTKKILFWKHMSDCRQEMSGLYYG